MRFAIIGCGVIGAIHARSIAAQSPAAEFVLAVDEIPDRAEELALQHGAEHAAKVSTALERTDIDAVAICTPSGSHADLAVAALDAGKHVVIEKPIDVTPEAAARIAEAAQRNQRTATVISQHRFDPASRLVRDSVQDGRLGRITSGLASVGWWRSQGYYESGEWRGTWSLDGGGAVMNQGIHTVDLLVWMLGQPVEVFAWTACLAHTGIAVEDTAVASVRFASGALGQVHATTAAYPGLSARLHVHGDRGSAVIDGDRLAYFHESNGQDVAPAYGGSPDDDNQAARVLDADRDPGGSAASDPSALSDAHADQYRDFIGAIAEGRDPLVTVAEATRTLAVVCGMYESARTGKPVAIPAFEKIHSGPSADAAR